MNIDTVINSVLWNSIKNNYENSNYSGAILDSIYYLSDLIRDKTGLESDGTALIGQAFGGTIPKLKINNLQTESEINIQKGIESILRGLFQAIRNPRSHEKYNDNKEDADAIIIFIDYMLRIIDRSKSQFDESDFLNRIFDHNFVENDKYAELLVQEIPPRKRLNITIEVYRRREKGLRNKLKYAMKALLSQLSDDEINRLYEVVSEEFKYASSREAIITLIYILPMQYWSKINEISRMRIENIILRSVKCGTSILHFDDNIDDGLLGTWISNERFKFFTAKDELMDILIEKLYSDEGDERDYVFEHFWDNIVDYYDIPSEELSFIIKLLLSAGNTIVYNKVLRAIERKPSWTDNFINELSNFSEDAAAKDKDDSEELPF